MKVQIGEIAVENLRKWGYAAAWTIDDEEPVVVKYASASTRTGEDSGPDEYIAEQTAEVTHYCYSCGSLFVNRKYTCPKCGMINASERMTREYYGTPEGYLIIEEGDLS